MCLIKITRNAEIKCNVNWSMFFKKLFFCTLNSKENSYVLWESDQIPTQRQRYLSAS